MVLYITTNVKSDTYRCDEPFALMYRRVNATFYESINLNPQKKGRLGEKGVLFGVDLLIPVRDNSQKDNSPRRTGYLLEGGLLPGVAAM